ncbi:uncharacterized protein LOC126648937 [Myiozetetes cayanensis]|uniref:uncharacterized protein LOC126648937 n=1 Tax=Myiozetetes cayanensis TaxID=478635 RepID=UPI00215EC06B|nr:uncharacterized protein LOC126648937 [Myiozetetes cayanensis]XP_050188614.1 uncharacterized protein LOC126648937 [Myiozetetes cayanensis]XP_050188615.1 uncharacterized protein LOC126648937 [Myiozetetes cayanensis]
MGLSEEASALDRTCPFPSSRFPLCSYPNARVKSRHRLFRLPWKSNSTYQSVSVSLCMHTLGMNRQSFSPTALQGRIHWLTDVRVTLRYFITGGFVKKQTNFELPKKKNCSNAAIHMEISACSSGREETTKQQAGSTSHVVLHLHFPKSRRKGSSPLSEVHPLTSLSRGEVWGAAAVSDSLCASLPGCSLHSQDSGQISPRGGCAKWVGAETPPGTPPESPPHITSQAHSLVSSHCISVLSQISFFWDDLEVWENMKKSFQNLSAIGQEKEQKKKSLKTNEPRDKKKNIHVLELLSERFGREKRIIFL